MRQLLEHKANVHAKDGYEQTALYWAAKKGHEAVIQQLLKHFAA